uniref:Helicase C-terminal domain-containing protein n=1 Tax=Panagrolaimus sp. ES5 TaxID=591445 RepID=A0AC34F951_9BILA
MNTRKGEKRRPSTSPVAGSSKKKPPQRETETENLSTQINENLAAEFLAFLAEKGRSSKFDHVSEENRSIISMIHPKLYNIMKKHQSDGLEFVYNRIVGKQDDDTITNEGQGSILAHLMGAGKTLTTVALIHTILNNNISNIKKVLIIAPKNVVANWKNEFKKWMDAKTIGRGIKVNALKDGDSEITRLSKIKHWKKKGKRIFIVSVFTAKLKLNLNKISVKFVRPIENGRTKDAKPGEVEEMKRRCHELFEKTQSVVHRRGVQVIIDEMKEKIEATFLLRVTEPQRELLLAYLTRLDPKSSAKKKAKRSTLNDCNNLIRILTHPQVFYDRKNLDDKIKIDWAKINYNAEHRFAINLSIKMLILMDIIEYCENVGDKLLVFSQSLETLNYIEEYLKQMPPKSLTEKTWEKNEDYLRVDGSVSSSSRDEYNKIFNKAKNIRCRLMLISTLAGSLGTNMIGANRVVMFDACWNPAHDIQSICRVYRIGQTKRVYIYRLITQGTVEEVVYKRQITKSAISQRVIDDEDIQRHFSSAEIDRLYQTDFVPATQKATMSHHFDDQLITTIFERRKKCLVEIISHDSFFHKEIDDTDILTTDSESEESEESSDDDYQDDIEEECEDVEQNEEEEEESLSEDEADEESYSSEPTISTPNSTPLKFSLRNLRKSRTS